MRAVQREKEKRSGLEFSPTRASASLAHTGLEAIVGPARIRVLLLRHIAVSPPNPAGSRTLIALFPTWKPDRDGDD